MDREAQRRWAQDFFNRMRAETPDDENYPQHIEKYGFDADVWIELVNQTVDASLMGNGFHPQIAGALKQNQMMVETFIDVSFMFFVLGHGWNAQRASELHELLGDDVREPKDRP
jgi:hypothetical protein